MKKFNILLFLSVIGLPTAMAAEGTPPPPHIFGLYASEILFVLLLVFLIILVLVANSLLQAFKAIYRNQLHPEQLHAEASSLVLAAESQAEPKKQKPSLWNRLLGLKPIEQEKDLLIPHSYDGIQELDNPVPGWFNFLFYGTILFGVAYLFYYHIGNFGPRQDEEYEIEMVQAAAAKEVYLAKAANAIDENSVTLQSEGPVLLSGKNIFDQNCVVCHGDKGQGGIGPNLTDEFWLHGGSLKDVFKVIKYGVLDKGMVSWEKTLTPKQISDLSNYIISLQGSNPAGAKAPQGEKYVAETIIAEDNAQ